MNPHYSLVARRAGHRCEYCHAPEAVFNSLLEVEHIVPISRDGKDTAANLALACRSCNLHKAAHVSGSDPESSEVMRLFHPREDQWEHHFQIVTASGQIIGRTQIGRATITRLEINSEAQVGARQHWMRLGLFP